jgi:type IV pilus assembly protein PilB
MTLNDFSKTKQQAKLEDLRRQEEEERTQERAQSVNLPYVDLLHTPIDLEALSLIKKEEAEESSLIILKRQVKKIWVAVEDPARPATQKTLKKLKEDQGFDISLFLTSPSSIKIGLKRYEFVATPSAPLQEEWFLDSSELNEFQKNIKTLEDLKKHIITTSTTNVLNVILAGALHSKASDIHFEPEHDVLRLRYRIDGVLQDVAKFSKDNYNQILSRVKLFAKLIINVHNIAQDGRFAIFIQEKGVTIDTVNVRVSIIPEHFGESIVMRLLTMDVSKLKLENLGLRPETLNILRLGLGKTNGMILTTGPTGAGKTTTLYTAIQEVNKPGIKIITVENPVEYKIEGVVQTQIDEKAGYTFANGLRAIVRQDPDIVLVGEIRDNDTASIAIQASLTGHLVLSTLHTNEAAGTIPRFIDLGVDKKTLPSSLSVIMAQRLVRRLCPYCKEEYEIDEKTQDEIMEAFSIISPRAKVEIPKNISRAWKAKGCPKCLGLGYSGQIGIYEVFLMDKKMEKLTLQGATTSEIREAAIDQGMITMLQDGLFKVIEGVTDLDEVYRVVGDLEYVKILFAELISQTLTRGIKITNEEEENINKALKEKGGLKRLIENSSDERKLALIMAGGIKSRATDVHIEPEKNIGQVRYRIDGILQNMADIPMNIFPSLIGEIKILSGLKTEIRNQIQEGRFNVKFQDKTQDIRVSIIPGGYGETSVLRILSSGIASLTLEDLGIDDKNLSLLKEEIKKPNGILLSTGPTGSGKTTTMYSVLNILNQPNVKIITIEDPIEYTLKGIIQTQVDESKGYTFASALKSLLRQNPNIILIGETRDEETAQAAIQASLTGHLVLSTLHTNDAVGTIARLRNMKISTSDIASSINAVIAQRLVRKVCPKCSVYQKLTAEQEGVVERELKNLPEDLKLKIFKDIEKPYKAPTAKGCDYCNFTGYFGQIGLFEILIPNEEFRSLILKEVPSQELEKKAKEIGMITLRQDGIIKILKGLTTWEEVEKTLGEE